MIKGTWKLIVGYLNGPWNKPYGPIQTPINFIISYKRWRVFHPTTDTLPPQAVAAGATAGAPGGTWTFGGHLAEEENGKVGCQVF